jgi:hypothetical protein
MLLAVPIPMTIEVVCDHLEGLQGVVGAAPPASTAAVGLDRAAVACSGGRGSRRLDRMSAVRTCLLPLALLCPVPGVAQPAAPVSCSEWRECRARVLEAIERGEFEVAHDLAWRAVQTGPRNDADLMYLLARAQALGGRAQDALVMLRRLAERGIAVEAATHPDFRRARELAAWPEVEALIEKVNAGAVASPPAPAPPGPAPAAPPVPSPAPAGVEPAAKAARSTETVSAITSRHVDVGEAVRFSADRFVAGGLVYDGVSQRFLFGDSEGRKLRVVGEGLARATDLVGAASAGFFTVMGLDIDARRGDLWVATAETTSGDAALHKLQLVSGRLLAIYPAAASLTPVRPVDLAVSQTGVVLALDALGGRLLRVRPGARRLESVMPLKLESPTSFAIARSGDMLYVAYRDGLARVDVAARAVSSLGAPKDLRLAGFEWLRPYRDGLVGLQAMPDGSRRVVLLELNARGRVVTAATVLDAELPARGPLSATIVGDDLCVFESPPVEDVPAGAIELIVRRIRLQ